MKVDNVDVIVEGAGPKAIVMIHGWPDTHRLWDASVEALKERYRCVRFTLPGFDSSKPRKAYSLDELLETLRRIVEQTCAGERVTLLLHDWGCFFGYQFAMRHPGLVERVIGVDIGDAGSRRHQAELGFRAGLMLVGYQVWLAAAWWIGGRVGDAMARWMARIGGCRTDPGAIHAQMAYVYAMRWFGVAGGLHGVRAFKPHCPMLFMYGERKPFMFHSRPWADELGARPGSRAIAFPTGHWIMVQRPAEFNAAMLAWLAGTDGTRS